MNFAEKKLFLMDLDGTVYLDEDLLPGAAEFLTWARLRGYPVRYLTNNSSRGVEAGLEKMRRLGVPARREEFLTAVEATVFYLRSNHPMSDIYYIIGTESFKNQLREAGFTIRETPAEDVTVLLVAYDTELTYQKVVDGCRLLARGVRYLATNPDLACPTGFGFVPDCGAICAFIGQATGKTPVFIGKPDPTMIHLALEQTGCKPEETLMVGDRLYTDIACGINGGVDTALVLTGEATRAEGLSSDTPPTVICENLAELLAALQAAQRETKEETNGK